MDGAYFAFPAVGRRGLAKVDPDRPGMYVVAGVLLLVAAGVVAYHLIVG